MNLGSSYQEIQLSQYAQAILQTNGKKTLTNLSKTTNTSYNQMRFAANTSDGQNYQIMLALKCIAQSTLGSSGKYLVADDTKIPKIHAKKIEKLIVDRNGSTNQNDLGLRVITAIETDGNVIIPIRAEPYVTKKIGKSDYKTKSSILIEILKDSSIDFKSNRVLADAHFSTHESVDHLTAEGVNYLMKVTCTKSAQIGNTTGQLKNILRLRKNQRRVSKAGFFNGNPCYFHVVKIKKDIVVYFISNDSIDDTAIIDLYRIRWNIELFHRTAKQLLGFSDCQLLSTKKQKHHMLSVMTAYAQANIQAHLQGFSSVDSFINHYRDAKDTLIMY